MVVASAVGKIWNPPVPISEPKSNVSEALKLSGGAPSTTSGPWLRKSTYPLLPVHPVTPVQSANSCGNPPVCWNVDPLSTTQSAVGVLVIVNPQPAKVPGSPLAADGTSVNIGTTEACALSASRPTIRMVNSDFFMCSPWFVT